MKRAWVFTNGELSRVPKIVRRPEDILIGVDGGTAQILKLGLKPDLIIGDMDSITTIPAKVKLKKYPIDKDLTDTELALNYCRENKIQKVIIVGFLGRRLDHMVSNLMVIAKDELKITVIEGNQELHIVKDKIALSGKKGDLVSFIPLLGDCKKVSTKGLKWRLQGSTLKVGSGRGVSNVMAGKKAQISLKKGWLMVILTKA